MELKMKYVENKKRGGNLFTCINTHILPCPIYLMKRVTGRKVYSPICTKEIHI